VEAAGAVLARLSAAVEAESALLLSRKGLAVVVDDAAEGLLRSLGGDLADAADADPHEGGAGCRKGLPRQRVLCFCRERGWQRWWTTPPRACCGRWVAISQMRRMRIRTKVGLAVGAVLLSIGVGTMVLRLLDERRVPVSDVGDD
ncbi:unnamed protein product, partial [Musa textilis]